VFTPSDNDRNHIVYHQPTSEKEILDTRAALVACPVAAIRVETLAQRRHRASTRKERQQVEQAWTDDKDTLVRNMAISPKLNNLELPFPRPVVDNGNFNHNIYYVGHHNEYSFGAVPYLARLQGSDEWIMIDTPKYSKKSVEVVDKLTSGQGPQYLVLSHVDDTAHHNLWMEHYPQLKRVFHSNDLGRYNWLNDKTLEEVEILLRPQQSRQDSSYLQSFTLDGEPIELSEEFWKDKAYQQDETKNPHDAILFHTPGHSPGSISLWIRPQENESGGVLFTGDTYAFSARNGGMSGFPRYGNNLRQQSETLQKLLKLDWDIICPGHGHPRDYLSLNVTEKEMIKQEEMEEAIDELLAYGGGRPGKYSS